MCVCLLLLQIWWDRLLHHVRYRTPYNNPYLLGCSCCCCGCDHPFMLLQSFCHGHAWKFQLFFISFQWGLPFFSLDIPSVEVHLQLGHGPFWILFVSLFTPQYWSLLTHTASFAELFHAFTCVRSSLYISLSILYLGSACTSHAFHSVLQCQCILSNGRTKCFPSWLQM